MMTSAAWWATVRDDRDLLMDWLQRQHRGEMTAAERIRKYCLIHPMTDKQRQALNNIAFEESLHAVWIAALIRRRGVKVETVTRPERYWDITLAAVKDLKTAVAVAAHAEKMRLERIRVIANDPKSPQDVRSVFQSILPMEEKHEQVFREMATPEALAATLAAHQAGETALGLINVNEVL